MRNYDDLVLVGHYYHHPSGDLLSDHVLAFDYSGGVWFPLRIERVVGDTVCSYVENGKRKIYPVSIKEFRSFQAVRVEYL